MSEEAEAPVADGRFERVERVDSGGLGDVWRGTDARTGDPVAIKGQRVGVNPDEEVRAGFRQELRWFRQLAGGPTPGSLVHFVDGEVEPAGSEGAPYVVTEFLDGAPVDRAFDGDGSPAGAGSRQPGVDALRAVAPHLARAVDFLHRNGILHLDCKPGNVIERERGPPALIDLNSAVSRTEGSTTLFHHDPYKPPELTPTELREAPAGPPADVYALGKCCCFLLAGEAPTFEHESLGSWRAVDPRDYGADCSGHLASVVWRATQPQPVDRYEDAGAFADALASALDLPDRAAELVDEQSGQRIRVRPGDVLGRWTPDRRVPHVALPDPEQLCSPVHASLEWDGTDWVLVDRSVNGTYVQRAGAASDREYVLSADGRERREAEGAPLPASEPPERVALEAGDRIAPVSPEFEPTLTFAPD